jgi:uncharacterized membrane protein
MDELDILKKDWQKVDPNQKTVSSKEIYPMLLKKSSSIVKTLFFISIAELIFWILINSIPYFSSAEYREKLKAVYGDGNLMTIITIFSYAIILLFVYLLFKSHKEISVTDNAKKLMESILKTRKVIKWYVIYNLVMAFLSLTVGLYFAVTHNPELSDQIAHFNNKQMFAFTAFMVVFIAVFIFVIWLFYRLIYGILLRRLNKNYKELKKLEV